MHELEKIVGADGVCQGEAAAPYAVAGVSPTAVALPRTREECGVVLRLARERGWSVVPYGGGTLIDAGYPLASIDLVLDTRRLNRVVDYQPDDQTVTVEPGVTLAQLQRTLSTRSQFLPLNPPLPDRATVGGMIATGATGSWSAGFGTPRDWLLGCRVLDGTGEEIRGGGQVVKNVAGYDLPKLYTGSFGTLGLLTELTLKVSPKPLASGFVRVDLANPQAVEALLTDIQHSDLEPTVLELVHRNAWRQIGVPEPDRPWSLFVQFLHTQAGVLWQMRRLSVLAGQHDGWFTDFQPEQGDALLDQLRDLPGRAGFVARLGIPSSGAAALAERVAALDPGLSVIAHASLAQLFACADTADETLAVRIRSIATEAGGACTFLKLPPALAGAIDPWGPPPAGFALMKGIKEALDPGRMFNPGRFTGGL